MSPYIAQSDRTKLDAFLTGLGRNVESKGELTYALTVLCNAYVDKHGRSFDSYSDILGCLTATTHEIYRAEIGKYEDVKKIANGPLKRTEYITVELPDPRRCPCGNGETGCSHPDCHGAENTTDGGW